MTDREFIGAVMEILGRLDSPKEKAAAIKALSARKAPAGKSTRLPEDWAPAAVDLAWAGENCPAVNLKLETEKFRNFFLARTGSNAVKLRWDLTWRNWIMTAIKDYQNVRQFPNHKAAARDANADAERTRIADAVHREFNRS